MAQVFVPVLSALSFAAVLAGGAFLLADRSLHRRDEPVDLRIRRTTFSVGGDTLDEIRRSLYVHGPMGHWGLTSWRFDVPRSFEPAKDGSCQMRITAVKLDITVRTPELSSWFSSPPACLRTAFDRMVDRLKEHEEGHVTIAMDFATQLRSKLEEIGRGIDCPTLEREANRQIGDIVAAMERRQLAFDIETQHGLKQGVVLSDCAPSTDEPRASGLAPAAPASRVP